MPMSHGAGRSQRRSPAPQRAAISPATSRRQLRPPVGVRFRISRCGSGSSRQTHAPASWPRGNRSTSPTRAVGVSREQMRNRAAKIKGFRNGGEGNIHGYSQSPRRAVFANAPPPECLRLGRDHAAAGLDELHQRAGPAVGGEPSRDRRLLRMACLDRCKDALGSRLR